MIKYKAGPSFPLKKGIKLTPKTIGKEKKIVSEVDSDEKHNLRNSADRKAQISKMFVSLTRLICALRSADFLR